MKNIHKFTILTFIFISFCYYSCHGTESTNAIMTAYHNGRFGDQLLLYYNAKRLAWLLNMPFLYQPFEYSDRLVLHKHEIQYTQDLKQRFRLKQPASAALKKIEPYILYEVSFYKPIIFPHATAEDQAEFLAHMRKMIAPRKKIKAIQLPKNMITVAVHVRKGGGHDWPLMSRQEYTAEDIKKAHDKPVRKCLCSDVKHPSKFPPDQYYIDQIKRLSELCGNVPMYLFIYTDDQKPEHIKQRYKKLVNKTNIVFDSKKGDNNYQDCVLDDFFNMMKFDCLIRATSSFSYMVEELGCCKIAISPTQVKWVGDILVVEEVKTTINDESIILKTAVLDGVYELGNAR